MDSWRKQKGEIHHRQDLQGLRSQKRKPPLASWQPTVPSWEKKFCTLVGSIPWRKLLETKKSMYLYDNVVKWNDSAGEEAFHNAKNRFWAEINNLPCSITLPDPDIYIDEIDWNSEIDPELIRDLEREPKVPDETDKKENVLILESALLSNQPFSCTGWGDLEEDLAKHKGTPFDYINENFENPRGHNYSPREGNTEDPGWGQLWDNPCGWNQRDTSYESNNLDNKKVGDWGARDPTQKKGEGAGQNMSRYKTSKFQGDNRQTDHGWRNVRGRQKASFAYEQPPENSRQWNSMHYCGQNHNDGFGEREIPYRWEKQQVL